MSTESDVVAYYDRKTDAILRKYGPGPRVHFHGGLIEPNTVPAASAEELRQQLVQSQEHLLHEAAHAWKAEEHLSGTIVDAGCGLGGSAVFWAQEYAARVFALTNVPSHLELIGRFATQAGVSDLVVPVLGDACAMPGDQVFDAAVAIDSSCHFDREAWFNHLSLRVRPGGRVFIGDSFARREEFREQFDLYFMTRIGTLDEYRIAATRAGFRLERVLDVTTRAAGFWKLSAAYSRLLLASACGDELVKRLQRSIRWHTWFQEQWTDGAVTTALLSFVHP